MGDKRRKMGDVLVEARAKGEVCKGKGKGWNGFVETAANSEVSEERGEVIYRVSEILKKKAKQQERERD